MFKDGIRFIIKRDADNGGQGGNGGGNSGTGDGSNSGQVGDGGQGDGTGDPEGKGGKVSLTQEQLDELITKRINRFKEDEKKAAEKKKNEADKYKGMTDAQKAEAEAEELRQANAELRKSIEHTQMSGQARTQLSEAGISVSDDMVGLLVADNAENTLKNVDLFKEAVTSAADKLWNKSRQGRTPGNSGSSSQNNDEEKSFGARMADKAKKRSNNDNVDPWAQFNK